MEEKKKSSERWHGAHLYSNKVHLFVVFFLFLAAAIIFWSYFAINKIEDSNPPITATPTQPAAQAPGVACTMEAKACADGVNFVGRTAPYCNFQACPAEACNQSGKDAQVCLSGYHCSSTNSPGTCVKD